MKFILDNWLLVSVALASGSMLMWPALRGGTGGALAPEEAVRLINRERAVVLDLREPSDFAAGHVGGARSVPLAQLEARLPELVKNKALPVVLVCDGGGQRALAAARKLGYEKANVLAGGLKAWKEANLPLEKA